MEKDKISLFTAIMMNINIMVGAGAFIMPSLMAQKASALSFLGWISVGIIFFPLVWSIAQITKFFPGQNNFYYYAKKGINKTTGFISGWLYFLGYAAMAAVVNMALVETLANQIKLEIIANNIILFNIVFIILFCLLNLLNISNVGKIQNAATIFKLFPLFFVILVIAFYYNPNLTFPLKNFYMVGYTLPLAVFGFWGFEASCNIAHLIKGDKRNAFRAVLIGFSCAVIIYTLFHFGLLHIMNVQNLINYGPPSFVQFLNIKSLPFSILLNAIISAAVIIAYASCVFGLILSDSANLHSMAKENLFPFSSFLKQNNTNKRPVYCVWLMGITIFLFIGIVNNKVILTCISNLGTLTAFILTMISMLRIQTIKKVNLLQKIPTILAFGSCLIISYYCWIIIGTNQITRFINIIPLIFLTLTGIIMFKLKDKNDKNKIRRLIRK